MAKRTQIGVNLPPEVERSFNTTRYQQGASNTQFVIAGLLCYLLSDPVFQERARSLARMVDEDKLPWSEAVRWVETEAKKRDRLYAQLVEQAIQRDLSNGSGTPSKRRSGPKG